MKPALISMFSGQLLKSAVCKLSHCIITLLLIAITFQTSKASVAIDSAVTAESTCQANGSIRVFASGTNAPFIYNIIAGPVTRPVQSSASFLSLPAGTYTVQVQNQAGETTTTTATVTGSYQLMSLEPIPVIACTNTSNGSIIGNLISGGKPPYTWQLVAPSPITTAPQVSDTFTNLPDGNYTIRVTDDCGNFQTTGAVLSSVPSTLTFLDYTNYLLCGDSGTVEFRFTYTNLQFPMTVTTTDDLGNSTTLTIYDFYGYTPYNGSWSVISSYQTIQIKMPLHHTAFGGVTWHTTITNACGVTATGSGYTASTITPISTGSFVGTCPPSLRYGFDVRNNQGTYTMISPDSIKYYLFDITLNTIVDSGGTAAINGGVANGIVGHSYRFIIVVPSCGKTYTSLDWVWATPAPPVVYPFPVGRECLDSTTALEIQTMGFATSSPLKWVIKSGPASAHSTKPGFEYSYALSYPDTFIAPPGELFELSNLPAGTYAFSVEDSCGQRIDSTITILPSDVEDKRYVFTSTISGQCGIFNAINLFIRRGDNYSYPYPEAHFTYTITNLTTGQVIETANGVDSISKIIYNVPSGTYAININFFDFITHAYYLDNNDFCTIVRDTIVVAGSPFPNITGFINSFCKANVTTQVIIDSTGGVAPYTYEIIAGPQIFLPQTSNIFNLPVIGAYTFRVVDACGNSYVSATDIDTLRFPPVTISSTPCPGANVLLIPVVSPFYEYSWLLPDGSSFTGDTLNIPSVSAADTGTYLITRYADINGCRDTVRSSLYLEMLARTSQEMTICQGDTARIGNYLHTTPGIYTDTLTAALGCDSIVTTSLTVLPATSFTQSVTICQNEPIVVGTHVHYITDTSIHVLYDTISNAAGCDSFVTTHVTLNSFSSRTDTITICSGDTLHLRTELHYNGSIIIDTVAITTSQLVVTGLYQQANGCDSSIFVRVLVKPAYFAFVTDTICPGETVAIGPYTHSQQGAYVDTLTSSNGCDSIILLVLTVREPDTTLISRNICTGQTFNGHTTTGIYIDTLQNNTGCDSFVILTLSVVDFLQDSVVRQICEGQSVTVAGHVYTQTGIYRDTLTTPFCDSIAILNLIVNPSVRDTLVRNICSGQTVQVGTHNYYQTGVYTDTLPTTGCDSIVALYLTVTDYKFDSTAYSICEGSNIVIGGNIYNQAGVYRDTVPSAPCDSISVIRIIMYANPIVNAMADKTSAVAGEPIQLNATSNNATRYGWISMGQLSNPFIPNPIGTISEPTWFIVTVTDSTTTCQATDSVFVDLLIEPCSKNNLFIPNAFTPNSDDANDVFRIFAVCPPAKLDVKIFNRWGEKVFESEDPYFKWNGYYKGVLQNPAVFVYYIEGAFSGNATFIYKGSVTLIR